MSKEIPQTLRPGQVVQLRMDGKALSGVRVICWNPTKERFEGTVPVTDCAGQVHTAPLSFGHGDVIGAVLESRSASDAPELECTERSLAEQLSEPCETCKRPVMTCNCYDGPTGYGD